jgi:hypothetical protein
MAIHISTINIVHFAILGAAGGGGGRTSGTYAYVAPTLHNGGCGSFITASYNIAAGTTLYYYNGKGGQGGQTNATSNLTTYGGNGRHGGSTASNDSAGEGGDFSGIFTGNGISFANALLIAGGGGGGAGGPHGNNNNVWNRCNGGGGISSRPNRTGQNTTAFTSVASEGSHSIFSLYGGGQGEGNDGTRGNEPPTTQGTEHGGPEGGQKNYGGRAGTAGGTAVSNATAGGALVGGNGSYTPNWGNGGGGGGGLYGGGGGGDDGVSWGGQGGAAGSSYIRGYLSDYHTSSLNSQVHQLLEGRFWEQMWGHTGGTSSHSGLPAYNMKQPVNITPYAGSETVTSFGYGGAGTTSFPGAGSDGKQGIICYKTGKGSTFEGSFLSGDWIQLTSNAGTLTSFTV